VSLPPVLLVNILRNPELCRSLSLREWDLLIRQARRSELLARLHHIFACNELIETIPEAPLLHLDSARLIADRHAVAVRWEAKQIAIALHDSGVAPILLKGAAYLIGELPPCFGRVFNDIDIIVPVERLGEVESILFLHGWASYGMSDYDKEYYRRWMHEIPPLRHVKRKTVIDVHHRILPRTSRSQPSSDKLLAAAVTLDEKTGVKAFAPIDMVLHSACHLFYEGEFDHGLRDLVDLDALLTEFSSRGDSFWSDLMDRADELELLRPLFYALRYTRDILGTSIPGSVSGGGVGTSFIGARWMDSLFHRGLMPDHASCNDSFTGIARWLLFVRGHYLRMPLRLLVPHLVRKAFVEDMKS